MRVLIIVPAYNEALNIEKTIKDLQENAREYDYVIINDCSKDNTKEICKKNGFNVISLPINYGLTSVVQIGMKYAKENGYDVVIGSRFVTEKKPASIRMLGSNILSLAIRIVTGRAIKDPTSGMRAYDKKAIDEFVSNNSLTPEPDTLVYMMKKGMKVKEIQVEMREREFGESYLNAFKSMEYMLSMMFSIIFIRAFTRKRKNGGK